MGTGTQTAEASEAHFCVPYLRNGALAEAVATLKGTAAKLNGAGSRHAPVVGVPKPQGWEGIYATAFPLAPTTSRL